MRPPLRRPFAHVTFTSVGLLFSWLLNASLLLLLILHGGHGQGAASGASSSSSLGFHYNSPIAYPLYYGSPQLQSSVSSSSNLNSMSPYHQRYVAGRHFMADSAPALPVYGNQPSTSSSTTTTTASPLSLCPSACTCIDTQVICRNRGLSEIPQHIPDYVTELRLEMNKIREIPPKAFARFRDLRRIDLNNNQIVKVASDAFFGLKRLQTLILYGNSISQLGSGTFKGLASLELLLLNANNISCVRQDQFADLKNLTVLSLYDNQLRSLGNGTLDGLRLHTLHLGNNPLICDCNLRWLSTHLRTHPIETSDARCTEPRRVARRRISSLEPDKFQCRGSEALRTQMAGSCLLDERCPNGCSCTGQLVNCAGRSLTNLPEAIPAFTGALRAADNQIKTLTANGQFKRLKQLLSLDLRRNQIESIEPNAFAGAVQLHELLLSENRLQVVTAQMFAGLRSLDTLLLRANHLTCITNGTFHDLPKLRVLSLHDNRIAYIQDGSLVGLSSLASVNLLNNPLDCSCPLRWLSIFLASNSQLLAGNPVCYTPVNLKQIPVQDVIASDFVCPAEEQTMLRVQKTCGLPLCPIGCECNTNGLVRCSNANFLQPPAHLEVSTRELYLDRNKITETNGRLQPLLYLEKLDLSNNELTVLTDHSFANLTRLHTLILSYNRIRCIETHAFAGLTRLRMLSLHSNNLSGISDGVFAALHSIRHVALGANPFYCDCRLRWLANWLRGDFNEPGIARCFGPDNMADRLLVSAPPSEFVCNRPTPNEILAKCDPCYEFPCANGGVCRRPLSSSSLVAASSASLADQLASDQAFEERSLFADEFEATEDEWPSKHSLRNTNVWRADESTLTTTMPSTAKSTHFNATLSYRTLADALNFTCECAPGFYGNRCEQSIDACFGAPCENGGKCRVLGEGQFECECKLGFAGQMCEQNIDDCVNNACENNSKCVDEINSYRCECSAHFTGKYCSKRIKYCSDEFNPCLNDARCVPLMPTLNANASDPIDMVSTSLNETLAVGYSCECDVGFTGKHCENNVDDCARHLCQNGAQCVDGRNSYTCKCSDGFSGVFCEQGGPQVELQQQQPAGAGSTCNPSDCVFGVCLQSAAVNTSGPNFSQESQCACNAGYSGHKCDRLTTISVFEGAYIELASPIDDWQLVNITFSLITRAERGVLLYVQSESETESEQTEKKRKAQPHLAVELYKGRLRISWMLGVHPVSTMFSFELLNDGRPHHLHLQVNRRRVGLAVDANKMRWITSDGGKGHLDNVKHIWYGGLDLATGERAVRARHVWRSDSFVGCLQKLQLNAISIDLRQSRKQQRVSAGCSKFERNLSSPSLSSNHKRRLHQNNKRRSSSSSSSSSTLSLAALQADGPNPQLASDLLTYKDTLLSPANNSIATSDCKRKIVLSQVTDNGCVSIKTYRQVRCVSSDDCEDCCRPARYRKRTIRFRCPNGERVLRKVSLPRSCRCVGNCSPAEE